MNQSYLPKIYCSPGRTVQVATAKYATIEGFCRSIPGKGVLAYSGWRKTDPVAHSDHLCGFAVDFVPKAGGNAVGYAQLKAAQAYAKLRGFPYTEFTWTTTNKHLHVSFARCPQ